MKKHKEFLIKHLCDKLNLNVSNHISLDKRPYTFEIKLDFHKNISEEVINKYIEKYKIYDYSYTTEFVDDKYNQIIFKIRINDKNLINSIENVDKWNL